MFDGAADVEEQLDAPLLRQAVAETGDCFAIHVFERQVRAPVGGSAAIKQVGDVGMFERGQIAALLAEAGDEELAGESGAEQLQRRGLTKAFALTFGEVDGAHASFGERPQNLPWADSSQFFAGLVE